MKIITREFKIYKYDELSSGSKNKVQNHFWETTLDDETNNLQEEFKSIVETEYPYFEFPYFRWSLSNCQGDGLSISFTLNLFKFMDRELPKLKQKAAIENLVYKVRSKGNRGRYCFSSRSDIEVEYNNEEENSKLTDNFTNNVLPVIQRKYMEVCSDLERKGYAAYDYLFSEENAREMSEANNYTYLEDGTMMNE